MYTKSVLFLILFVYPAVLCKPLQFDDPTCGYESCHPIDPDKLNIHLIPHSHDDVGWLKTVDQYFYGNKFHLQQVGGVQHIIDSVVQALDENPDRRFIQVETAFFNQWWKQQDDATKTIVQGHVNAGRLEIVGGAWSMNDEAATNYQSIIDQFTLGLRTIDGLVGKCGRPKIGWQIDPFGHTREMASIFAGLGYDGLFFTRLDYRDIEERQKTKNTEFIWRGNPDLGQNSDIFTSLIHRFYNAPDNFCWDIQCRHTPIITDEESPEYNVEEKVQQFAEYAEEQAKYYPTNNVLITMGGDFTFQQAEMYYINMDRLIAGFKKFRDQDINIIYSTPSCYVKAVNDMAKSKQVSLNLKTDDFMPYASDPYTYWTGYYTSRPNSKHFERQGNNLLQATKQIAAFGKAKGKNIEGDLTKLKEVMGIMQHHDAITGTEKQHVTDDYVKMITASIEKAGSQVNDVIAELLRKNQDVAAPVVRVESCLLANISRCEPSTAKRFLLAVYNPLSRPVNHYVRIPVTSVRYTITGMKGITVSNQVIPSIDKFENNGRTTPSLYELVFLAKSVPALGVKYFYVVKEDEDVNKPDLITPDRGGSAFGTSMHGFELDQDTGFLKSVLVDGKSIPVKQEFLFYRSANGTNASGGNRASGAYIFRPSATARTAISITNKATVTIYTGKLFDEVQQQFNSWIKQAIRVYKDENYIEFDWVVGPIEYSNNLGVEVITRFTTQLATKGVFYTDSNGRGLIKRTRDYRDTFTYTNEEPVSGNYYPVTSRIVLKDEAQNLEFAVLNDRAQGGSSLKDGEVELMVHRRLKNDDAFGVDEVLNEEEFEKGVIVRGQHYLTMATNTEQSPAAIQHDLVQRKLHTPWLFVGDATSEANSLSNLLNTMNFKFSGITNALPENVQILTLEPWNDNELLLRLEHVFESGEDAELSKATTIDLKGLLTLYKINSIREMTLGANQELQENQKLQWTLKQRENLRIQPITAVASSLPRAVTDEDLKIVLNPMQIRTFIIGVENEDKTPEEICEGDECRGDERDDDDDGGAFSNTPYVVMMLLIASALVIL